MILVFGFNFYPNEIECVISSHPNILEFDVLGFKNKYSGEAVKAFVVGKNSHLTEAALRDFCRQYLTAYKVPKLIVLCDQLPKSNVGKILWRELR